MIVWLYPERCPVCHKIVLPKGAMLHTDCKKKLDTIQQPTCMKCGRPCSDAEEYCTDCSSGLDRGWDAGSSLFPYHGVMGTALRLVKQDGRVEFVRFFAKQMKQSRKAFIEEVAPDCIVPVPLHPSKQRRRGFNQAELLAEALGKELDIPVRLLLRKQKRTKEQKKLSKQQRKRNVSNAFCVDTEEMGSRIPESVLLLDDVSTTGSTLTACAKTLKAYGVRKVAYISVCVADC